MAPYHSRAYLAVQVQTSDRVEILISLYEAALGYIAQAMEAAEKGDAVRRGDRITKAAEILLTLCDSIDYSQPGNLSGHLFSLYTLHLRQLLEANRNNDLVALQTVHSSLSILLNGWREAAQTPEAEEVRRADAEKYHKDAVAGVILSGQSTLAMTA